MNERAKATGRNVARYREAADLSQADLAKAIGVRSQNTIASIELGKTAKSKHLADIARVLKKRLIDLDPQFSGEELVTFQSSDVPRGVGPGDVPIYSSFETGADALLGFAEDPIDMAPRPAQLERVRRSYGLRVAGEAMFPWVRPGDTALIDPHKTPRQGDLCLFRRSGRGSIQALFREFRGQTAREWTVRQYQPRRRDQYLKKADWPECHVVVSINLR
jgi:transcriptional regulator with XRE-family HTH domain